MTYKSVDMKLSQGSTNCRVNDDNNGNWVVLVHGLITPQFAWGFLFNDLVNAGYKVVSFDLYGRGKSDIPAIDYTFEVYLRQLDDVINQVCGNEKVHLIGWSMGAALTSLYAMEHSKNVRSVVLIAPGIVISTGRLIKHMLNHSLTSYLFVRVGMRLLKSRMQQHFYKTEDRTEYMAKALEQTSREGFWPSLMSIIVNYPEDLSDRLKGYSLIAPKPLIIWGKNDSNTPYADSKLVTHTLNGHLFGIENAAHAVHYEYPTIVNKEIIAHLKHAEITD